MLPEKQNGILSFIDLKKSKNYESQFTIHSALHNRLQIQLT